MDQSSSTVAVALALLIFTSVISMGSSCELTVIGGGCPDSSECLETCRPCFRGRGKVHAFCIPAGGGIPYDQCVCRMLDGASCKPKGPPECPRPWPPSHN